SYGGGAVFYRGGFSYRYDPDPDAEIEYYVGGLPVDTNIEYYIAAVDEDGLTPWSLDENPDVLLRLLSLPRHPADDPDAHWIEEDAILGFLEEFGALTMS